MQTETIDLSEILYRYTGTKNIDSLVLTRKDDRILIKHLLGLRAVYLHPCGLSKNPEYPTQYALVELLDLITSHNALQGFRKNYDFVSDIQDRNYENKSEQAKVVEIAAKLNPAYLLSDSITAAEGTPIITPKGLVLSGNARTMALVYATKHYPKHYRKYIKELRRKAHRFALTKEEIGKFDNPLLVRIVNIESDTQEAIQFGRIANAKVGAARSEVREASHIAEMIPNDLLLMIKGADESMLSKIIDQRPFKRFLLQHLPTKDQQQIFNEDKTLSDTGKNFVKRILLIKCLGNVNTIELMTKRHYRTFESCLPVLIDFRQREAEGLISSLYSISNLLSQSLKFYRDSVLAGGFSDYADYLTQLQLDFIKRHKPAKRIHQFLLTLDILGTKPKIFKRFIAALISRVTGESGLASGLLKCGYQPLYEIIKEVRESEVK